MKLEDFLIQEEGNDSKRLPDGRFAATWDAVGHVWNIGPGLTRGVTKDTIWTAEELKAAEEKEFAATRAAVTKLVKVPLGENQTTALQSLVYNIGEAGFAHSTVLRRVNASDFANVPPAFRMWNKGGKPPQVIRGLVNRREDEIRLWLHPDDVPPPADLKTSANVPPASFGLPQPKEPSMATATPAVPATSPVAAKPLVAAAVQTATLPISSLWTTFTGMFSGVGVSAAAAFLSTFAPSLTAQVLAYAGVAAGLVSAAAHGYTLFSGVSATNNATLMLAENLLNQVETALGGKPFVFDNDPTPQTSS